MPARFLLTFDCEGRWGVADHLSPSHRRALTDERLRQAYRSIIDLLDDYGIDATFAFVGAFSQSRADFARLRPALEAFQSLAPNYVGPILRDVDESGGDGWHGAGLLDMVANAQSGHEIALHGVTHVPWTSMDEPAAAAEMAMLSELKGPVRDSRTFVYPRNLVAHTDELAEHGFQGFRLAPPKRSRARSLLAEFNIFERPEQPAAADGIHPIPAGFFLNWRSGTRRLVPARVTLARIRALLRAAGATGGIVHYWLHPENIASAPSTLSVLRMLVREVANARDAGNCNVLTQLGYCRRGELLP